MVLSAWFGRFPANRIQYLLFTREEGAEEHCQMGAMLISNARVLDWLDGIMMNK